MENINYFLKEDDHDNNSNNVPNMIKNKEKLNCLLLEE